MPELTSKRQLRHNHSVLKQETVQVYDLPCLLYHLSSETENTLFSSMVIASEPCCFLSKAQKDRDPSKNTVKSERQRMVCRIQECVIKCQGKKREERD